MAAVGKPIDDEKLVSYICTGLDIEFNPVVSAILARVEPISVTELATQLNAFEQRMDLLHGSSGSSSVNLASRGRGNGRGGNRGRGNGHGRGNNGGSGRGRGGFNNSGKQRVKCQLCRKEGHQVVDCWYKFDENFVVPEEKSTNTANHGYGVDSNWYADTGATDHISAELDKMVIRDRYTGGEQIQTANGLGMDIAHVGRLICHTPQHNLFLNNVLHVPSTKKNLVLVHKLALDNNAFIEFHPNLFFIKDQTTRRTLMEGTCKSGRWERP
jgi:histone deacetylase 1/2